MSDAPTPAERFMAKVEMIPEHPCWEWMGWRAGNGYGRFWRGAPINKSCAAHRWAYERFVGPIPDGLQLDHLCRNRGCVNPDHLEPVTQQENILRGNGMAARHARKTHCVRGHPFDGQNTHYRRRGGRRCRTCDRDRAREGGEG